MHLVLSYHAVLAYILALGLSSSSQLSSMVVGPTVVRASIMAVLALVARATGRTSDVY